jgi:hypothetical protein
MKFTKLFTPEPFCILSPDYFKIVMESASQWAKIAYDSTPAKPGWYKKNIFTKEQGYIMTGFKMDWSANAAPTGNDMFDMFGRAPIQMLFVPEAMAYQIKTIKSQGCKVLAQAYGTAKIMHSEYRIIPIFCLMVTEFITELSDKELRAVESVDALVGG